MSRDWLTKEEQCEYEHHIVRRKTIEECEQELTEMIEAAEKVGTHKQQIAGLASARAAIRALKEK